MTVFICTEKCTAYQDTATGKDYRLFREGDELVIQGFDPKKDKVPKHFKVKGSSKRVRGKASVKDDVDDIMD